MPPRPPPQAAPQVEGRAASRRDLPVDHPGRPDLHHRTHPLSHLNPAAALARAERIHSWIQDNEDGYEAVGGTAGVAEALGVLDQEDVAGAEGAGLAGRGD